MKTYRVIVFLSVLVLQAGVALADANEPQDISHPKTLDGIYVQAVETYINSKNHEISLGMGFYPFNAYYNGFSVNGAYTHYFNSTLGWEVLNGSMVFSVQKDLTSQLAEKYAVNPERIERLEYVASTNLIYVFSYGKNVLFRKILEYSRTGLIAGVGIVKTSLQNRFAASIGFNFGGYLNESISWRLEFRDNITTSDFSHFGAVSFGTCLYL